MSKMILATAVLLTAGAVSSQSYFMPNNNPQTGAACNVIPFGTVNTDATWVNQKYQCMATQAELSDSSGPRQAGRICDIAFAPCGTGAGNQHFDTIEIVLAQTNATSLSTTFASNLTANVQTVLKATNYDWHVTGSTWNRIGFDVPYNYIAALGANLVIEITMTGNHKTGAHGAGFYREGTHQRVYAISWTGSPPATGSSGLAALKWEVAFDMADLSTFGVGCPGTNNLTPSLTLLGSGNLGTSVGLDCNNCLPNAVVLHVIGLTRFEPRIDLAIIGAPRCFLYETVDLLIGGVANGSGVYSWKVGIPKDKNLLCIKAYTQVFPSDPNANTWGRTASDYGRILIGN